MDDVKIKEGSIICKVNKKRVDPPSEDSETPLDGAVLPPSSDDVGTLSNEPTSFSTDIPQASEFVDEMPSCSNQNDITIDLRNTQIPGITCRITIVVNKASESG